jgi:hypothetical protein
MGPAMSLTASRSTLCRNRDDAKCPGDQKHVHSSQTSRVPQYPPIPLECHHAVFRVPG